MMSCLLLFNNVSPLVYKQGEEFDGGVDGEEDDDDF